MPQDWTFDIGYSTDGKVVVEAFASTMPDKRMRLTREQLTALRSEIDAALHKYPEPPKDLKPGTQVIYVPMHARGNTSHPDCETGFVVSVHEDHANCRYWSRHAPGELRTKANGEWTPISCLVVRDTIEQSTVGAWLEAYYLGLGDVNTDRPGRTNWGSAFQREAYQSGRAYAELCRRAEREEQ